MKTKGNGDGSGSSCAKEVVHPVPAAPGHKAERGPKNSEMDVIYSRGEESVEKAGGEAHAEGRWRRCHEGTQN